MPPPSPTPQGLIDAIENWLGASLPSRYVDFLLTHTEQIFGDEVLLYPADYLIERNETFETKTYCPGYIAIGDDSGGRAFLIPINKPVDTVYMVGHGYMSPKGFRALPLGFEQWLSEGCPLP
jgi:hypothetical protein